MLDAAATLFRQGLPDPRGCEYREIEALQIDWLWDRIGDRGAMALQKKEGWILPEVTRDKETFAIGWDGLIYRTESVGKKADLSAYVAESVENRTQSGKESGLLETCLLLRLGEVELAAAMMPSRLKNQADWVAYLEPAETWCDALFKLGISARMKGLDSLAEAYLCEYGRACDRIVPEGRRRMGTQARYDGDDLLSMFGFNDEHRRNVKRLVADQVRRRTERPTGRRTLRQVKEIPDQGKRIKALIEILDEVNVQALPLDDPGFPDLTQDPIVQALTEEGLAAFPALLRSYERDDRMTRSVAHWRWNHTSGEMAPVRDAAAAALFPLLGERVQIELNAYVKAKNPSPDRWPLVIQSYLHEWWKRTKPNLNAASDTYPRQERRPYLRRGN
jgi:hypothetical protein